MVVKAHFDGKSIILDEPVDLPVNEPLELEFRIPSRAADRRAQTQTDWDQLISCVVPGLHLPEDAFHRESFYEDPA